MTPSTYDRQILLAEARLWQAERERRLALRTHADTGPWMNADLKAAGIDLEVPEKPWDAHVFVGTIDGQPFTLVEDDTAWYTSYINEWTLYRGHVEDGIPEDAESEIVAIPNEATPCEALYALVWTLIEAGLIQQPPHEATLMDAEYVIAQHDVHQVHPPIHAFLDTTRWAFPPVSLVEQTRARAVATFGERFVTTPLWDASRMEVTYPEPRTVAPDANGLKRLIAQEHNQTRQMSLPAADGTVVRLDLDMYGAWHVHTCSDLGRMPIRDDDESMTPIENWAQLLYLLSLSDGDDANEDTV